MFEQLYENVIKAKPLIHSITNYVTANDCANSLLACKASPIMADAIEEVEEITTICQGLNINMGTLNQNTIPSMLLAGKKSNELGHPVILDPVGVGASKLRRQTARTLLEEIHFSVIKGNISEIKILGFGGENKRGVDANLEDQVRADNLEQTIDYAKEFANSIGSVIAITGEIDIVTDGKRAYCIYNGHKMMSAVTGTGCQLSAVISAFVSANPQTVLEAVASAVCAMGLCGEKAYERMQAADGNATYRTYIIDELYNLTPKELKKGAKYDMR